MAPGLKCTNSNKQTVVDFILLLTCVFALRKCTPSLLIAIWHSPSTRGSATPCKEEINQSATTNWWKFCEIHIQLRLRCWTYPIRWGWQNCQHKLSGPVSSLHGPYNGSWYLRPLLLLRSIEQTLNLEHEWIITSTSMGYTCTYRSRH